MLAAIGRLIDTFGRVFELTIETCLTVGKTLILRHFELVWESTVLIAIYIAGAVFLARYGDPMLLTAWLTGGVVIGSLVRAFQSGPATPPPAAPPAAPEK